MRGLTKQNPADFLQFWLLLAQAISSQQSTYLPSHRLQRHSVCAMRVNATHQPLDDPERRAPDAQCVVLRVRTQQALEAAQARRRQAVVAVAAVQLDQQGDAVQGLLPHLLVLTGKLQVSGRNFAVWFPCFQQSLSS